jgi:flagellar biosynthetic protein FliO
MQNFIDRLPLDPRLKKLLPYIIYFLALLALGAGVWLTTGLQKANPGADQTQAAVSDMTGSMVGAFFKLVFVLGLVFLTFTTLKWWQTKRPGQLKKRLSVIETVTLNPRRAIHLIKVGSKEFLVGATDHSMNLISEVPYEEAMLVESVEAARGGSFAQVLKESVLNPIRGLQKQQENKSHLPGS